MQTPLVSIIIPTYNRAHLIGETLDSVLAQTYTNWECIVVDDGSTDHTDQVLRKFCEKDTRFQYHHRPIDRPKGANACRNYGFELSKGEYIQWFDSDDILLDKFLDYKVKAFTRELDLVICAGFYVDENLKKSQKQNLVLKTNLYKDYVLWNLKVFTPSILFKKSFLENKELFSLKIRRGQETELFSRLFFKLKSTHFIIINEPLFLYRQHQDTKTFKNKIYNKKYKESSTNIAIDNFKKAIVLRDKELITYFYNFLIKMFFMGLENNHKSNSKNILLSMIKILYDENKGASYRLFFLGYLCYILNRRSFKVEKKIKSFKII